VEHAGVEVIHHQGLDARVLAVKTQLDLLRDQLRDAGLGADQDGELKGHLQFARAWDGAL